MGRLTGEPVKERLILWTRQRTEETVALSDAHAGHRARHRPRRRHRRPLFGGVASLQALRAGVDLATVIQPILVFALIGLTVGGLAGPLRRDARCGGRRER